MADHVEQIKSRLDIVDVISSYIKVQKSGVNFKAPCPFHNEKTPSFYISPERQIWHCFGCSKGGDMFGFIKEIEGVEFLEALRVLAARAGVELEEFDPKLRDAKTRLFQACEAATKFFEKQLFHSDIGKKALAYLGDRGLVLDTIKKFRLGFAPNDWHALGTYLRDCGYAYKELVDAGLAIQKSAGPEYYDRFRSRIMFPIQDLNGQVVGFTARIFEDTRDKQQIEQAKYINSPQTVIYDKSRILYGLAYAKTDIKQANKCLMVEGNMDAIMSYQAGVQNVVATSGTALTQNHLQLLKRYTTNLDFCFDTDQAGAIATRRGIGIALNQDFNIKVVKIKDASCKDPADYVQKYDAGWIKAVNESEPVIQFYFEKAAEQFKASSPESKKSIILAVAPFIKRLTSKVEQAHWVSHIANFLRVKEGAVEADIATAKDDMDAYETQARSQRAVVAMKPVETVDILNEALLSVLLKNPNLFKEELKILSMDFLHPQVKKVAQDILLSKSEKVDLESLIKKTDQDYAYTLEVAYLKSQELWKDIKDEDLKAEFNTLLRKLKQRSINSRLASLEYDIKSAESQGDKNKLSELINQFTKLTQELVQAQKV